VFTSKINIVGKAGLTLDIKKNYQLKTPLEEREVT